ncbi:MAG: hypothetical protein IT334_10615, partial [Thermomicrobiales bacterium]|nr:hypothetical protein [Thermomicrobiales bacterium]
MTGHRGWRIALGLVLVAVLGAGFGAPARASVSFSVTPGLVDLAGTPGSEGTHDLSVRNKGDEAVTLAIAIEATPGIADERSAVGWLSTPADSVEIAAGEGATLTVSIAIPSDATTGGYYAGVSLTSAAGEVAENEAALSGQLVVGFLITVDGEGNIARSARIERFAPVLETDGRIGFRAEIINDGNVHLIAPRGEVVVQAADGSAAGSLAFPESTPLLPGITAVAIAQGSLPLSPGDSYRADGTFHYLNGTEPLVTTVAFVNQPDLEIGSVAVCENLDRGPSLSMTLTNQGDLGLQPVVVLSVATESGQLLGSAPIANGAL